LFNSTAVSSWASLEPISTHLTALNLANRTFSSKKIHRDIASRVNTANSLWSLCMMEIDPEMVTTAFELPGYRVERNLGIVRGIVVRSRSVIGNFGAAIQTIFGGNITIYTQLCEKARGDAYRLMVEHAAEMGANAIIGVRYDANEVAAGVTEVLAYGSAVVAESE
jgi:uncharacterized protein YbjQ (UPF0145 family)